MVFYLLLNFQIYSFLALIEAEILLKFWACFCWRKRAALGAPFLTYKNAQNKKDCSGKQVHATS